MHLKVKLYIVKIINLREVRMVSQILACSITKIDEDDNMINLGFKACFHLWP